MNPQIKAKWVKALRSGKYAQGTGMLRADNKFCCLGVLCDIYAKANKVPWERNPKEEKAMRLKGFREWEVLPAKVRQWAGLKDRNPDVSIDLDTDSSLADMNDDGATFRDIALAIERSL